MQLSATVKSNVGISKEESVVDEWTERSLCGREKRKEGRTRATVLTAH